MVFRSSNRATTAKRIGTCCLLSLIFSLNFVPSRRWEFFMPAKRSSTHEQTDIMAASCTTWRSYRTRSGTGAAQTRASSTQSDCTGRPRTSRRCLSGGGGTPRYGEAVLNMRLKSRPASDLKRRLDANIKSSNPFLSLSLAPKYQTISNFEGVVRIGVGQYSAGQAQSRHGGGRCSKTT